MTAAPPGPQPAAGRKPRRERNASESLLSIVLGLEAILVFFMAIAVFGLRALPPVAAFAGGAALTVALVLVAGLLRFRWGVWLGWVLQAALLATGVILPVMYVVAAVFVGIWIFCFVKGRQLDFAKQAYRLENPKENP